MANLFSSYCDNAQLAFASYAPLHRGMSRTDYIDSLINEAKMAPKQASLFASTYAIVDQQPNTASGFSATVFKKGEQYFFAIRGTEITDLDDLSSDLGDIGGDGIAFHQILDMYNYYLRLTARSGESVYQYSYDENTGRLIINSFAAQMDGLLAGKTFTVTGHSLG